MWVDLLGPFPVGPGQVKYLIVAIDYYTKWVEVEPLDSISSANCRKFMWRQVISRFRIPKVVISDNGTQFADKKFGLKKRIDQRKGAWADELASVLWSYRTTPQSSTRKIPILTYLWSRCGIPVEVGEPSLLLLLGRVEEAMEKELVDKTRKIAHLSETALK
ncbi:uncharacterized protein [Arachis hypogaea]|uniref:uncharacterized protein n=1 Tax=Arachis hypogaea TaxID=3818 RepID=UPI003B210574